MTRRSLFDTLRDVRGGEAIEELDANLQRLVRAVLTTGGGGRLTLTLDVQPSKGSTEIVVVKDTIKLKEPEIKSKGTVMFPTAEGNLQRQNPNQRELPGLSLASDGAIKASAG